MKSLALAAIAAVSLSASASGAEARCKPEPKLLKKLISVVESLQRNVDQQYASVKKHAGSLCVDDPGAVVDYK